MTIRKSIGRLCSNGKWFYNGMDIETVSRFKYLGVWISPSLNWSYHLSMKSAEARAAMGISWKNVFDNPDVEVTIKFKVFESIVLAIILYAAPVWGHVPRDELEKIMRYFMKRIYRLPRNTPNYVFKTELGISDVSLTSFKLHMNYKEF